MLVFNNFDRENFNKNSIVTVGTFDGVHNGHREIFRVLNNLKENSEDRTVVVTFEPHPRIVLGDRNSKIKLLSTLNEKKELFSKLGIDAVCVIEFSREFSEITAENFLLNCLINGTGLKSLVLGFNHSFGRHREGNYEMLKPFASKYSFDLHKVDELKINGFRVSSTTIRKLLLEGDVENASLLLGEDYSIFGEVVTGDRRGNTIGFPTANISVNYPYKLIPKKGVYCVSVEYNGLKYFGMMNIGNRPTVSSEGKVYLEVNIFDFEENIYGKNLKVSFINYIRDELKFNSLDSLVGQLKKDKEKCFEIIKNKSIKQKWD